MFQSNQLVHHSDFGTGTVLLGSETTVVVHFDHGIESCETESLISRWSVVDAIKKKHWSPTLDITLKSQAAAIRSLNDAWGVFSRSRIELLPHQLWVCHRTLQQWPIRKLIADDVGLGKTIEAGLILWPLLSSGKVRRFLILTPASLIEQWQSRLRTLFDIRTSVYHPAVDRPKSDFWNTHNQVIASLPTMRMDHGGRHERLLDAPAWDMLIVDEAHHLNVEEHSGKTRGYKFVEELMADKLVQSCLFFTGTPHRGKRYGFWSLMHLLQPEIFDPHIPDREQLPKLKDVMIRNFKQKVTDMDGNKLFQPVNNRAEICDYSDSEKNFYDLLTKFIREGKTYASGLDQQKAKEVSLVLIGMQKIASSSVAAIRATLTKRIQKIELAANELRDKASIGSFIDTEEESAILDNVLHWVNKRKFKLLNDELSHLTTLLEAAELVKEESKILRICEIIDSEFKDRSVLLFTEYKTTQSLIVSTLMKKFGKGSVGFINGDDYLTEVYLPAGEKTQLPSNREHTANSFNQGEIRFLVSTEAGGEGIDLQAKCHTLIHVDLPWNPMRLHQRVGRLNRYGQNHPVDVVTIRNPNTVETRIWEKLEDRLTSITMALSHAMDEPEDLMQMILGMADSNLYNELFSEGQIIPLERLDEWFDTKTRSLGGKSAIQAVNEMFGHCQSFDLTQLDDVPKADLPDLENFFYWSLHKNNRRPDRTDGFFSFETPEVWRNSPGVRRRYNDLKFHRQTLNAEKVDQIVGVGHQVFDQALAQAVDIDGGLTLLREVTCPLAVFSIQDALTSRSGHLRKIAVGVSYGDDGNLSLLRDIHLLNQLNQIKPLRKEPIQPNISVSSDAILNWLDRARDYANQEVHSLRLPFQNILLKDLALFWPEKLANCS